MIFINNNIVGLKLPRSYSEKLHIVHNPVVDYLKVTDVPLGVTDIKEGDIIAVYTHQLRPIILQDVLHYYTKKEYVLSAV